VEHAEMASVVNGQDDATLNQAILEHFNPSRKLSLRIEAPRELSYSDLEQIFKLLDNKKVSISRLELSNSPYPHTLNIVFVRPSLKQGYRSDWEPVQAISALLGQVQNWELAEAT
jgi:hypothetical protein